MPGDIRAVKPLSRIPTRKQALQILEEGEALNPGPWTDHSRNVALAAQILAGQLTGMDPDAAFVLGLLHDIGRRAGVSDMRHIIDGYRYMTALGLDCAARICLTHSFPLQDIRTVDGNWDGSPEDRQWIADFLVNVDYTAYDRLIQLCDAVALPQGFCLIEKRLVEVSLRRGVNPLTVEKWKAFFAIQADVEQEIGASIYRFLPGVIETTFRLT